jgi:hypothetical protein
MRMGYTLRANLFESLTPVPSPTERGLEWVSEV